MAKTITLRVEEKTYNLLKKAARGERRTVSNFLENAALSYISEESFITDSEMESILEDKELLKNFKKGKKDIKEGRYRIVS